MTTTELTGKIPGGTLPPISTRPAPPRLVEAVGRAERGAANAAVRARTTMSRSTTVGVLAGGCGAAVVAEGGAALPGFANLLGQVGFAGVVVLFVGLVASMGWLDRLWGRVAARLGGGWGDSAGTLGFAALGSLLVTWTLSPAAPAQPAAFLSAVWFSGFAGALLLQYGPTIVRGGAAADTRRVIIVGSGPRALRLMNRIAARADCEILGFVDSDRAPMHPRLHQRKIGTVADLESLLMTRDVDEVLIALPVRSCHDEIQQVIETCERTGTVSKYLADVFDTRIARPAWEEEAGLPLVSCNVSMDEGASRVKRVLDVTLSCLALVVAIPLMLLIALAIKLTSDGPVLFVQDRWGKNRRRFPMYKFRTMVPDAERLQPTLEDRNESNGPAFKIRHDPRVTPVGRILRRTSLDELPQLLNVVRGDMSLVGPRPLPDRDVSRCTEPRFMRRFSIRPGLTGLWQISGRSELDFESWVGLDLRYIDEWSVALDLSILARTIPAIIDGKGAH